MAIKVLVVLSILVAVMAGAPLVFMACVCVALLILSSYQAVVEFRAA